MRAISILGLLVILSTGCVSSRSMAIGQKYPPRPKNFPIDVYLPSQAPIIIFDGVGPSVKTITATEKTSHEDIMAQLPPGTLRIGRIDSAGAPAADWGAVVADAKQKARDLGGSAIIIAAWGQPLNGFYYGQANYGKRIDMVVFRYK